MVYSPAVSNTYTTKIVRLAVKCVKMLSVAGVPSSVKIPRDHAVAMTRADLENILERDRITALAAFDAQIEKLAR